MTSLLYRLGAFAQRRRRSVLAAWLAAITAIVLIAMPLAGSFSDSSSIPGSPAQRTLEAMDRHFPAPDRATAQVVFRAPGGQRIDAPRTERAVERTLAAAAGVDGVVAVTDAGDGERSASGTTLVAEVELSATEEDGIPQSTRDALDATADPARAAGLEVIFGGSAFGDDAPPVSAAEGIGLLVALLVLVVTFGSLLAAGMPLLTAILGIVISLAGMLGLTAVVGIPDTALTLSMMIGLAVGIDYSLLIVSRHRMQLAAGMPVARSIARANATAGSAVVFAGLTVVIALAGLTVAGVPMLTGMGLSAAGSVAVAVLLAVGLVPALLGLAGERLVPKPGSRSQRQLTAAAGAQPRTAGAAWTRRVIARPWLASVGVVALLGVMAIPALSLQTALTDDGNESATSSARQAYDAIGDAFGPGANGPLVALVTGGAPERLDDAATAVAERLERTPGVAAVGDAELAEGGGAARVPVIPASGPKSPETKQLVKRLQATSAEAAATVGADAAITGQTAVDIDVGEKLSGALIPFGAVVVGLSLLLLLIAFRSIAIPIKAAAGFLLSIGASFGATVAVFQWGWLSGLLGVSVEGPVASFMPIIVMAVLFGLAMDYEVFMVSAMREEHARTGRSRAAIVAGAGHAARVVTAAALIMVAVFGSFLTHTDADIKAIAWALAIGVLIDAFLVRMTLVPAVLALLGDRAWWVPPWLDRVLPRVDFEGGDVDEIEGASTEGLADDGDDVAGAATPLAVGGKIVR